MAGPNQQYERLVAYVEDPTRLPKCLASPIKTLEHRQPAPVVSEAREKTLGDPAIVSGNSSRSRLLHLPLEVRLMIYRALVGEKLVHVRLDVGGVNSRSWRHVICHGDGARISIGQQGHRDADDWEPSHLWCRRKTNYDPNVSYSRNSRHEDEMHLSILRCCKQTYTESNPILWSTNTFSIHDHQTLRQFLIERKATQKSLMRSLRLRFDLTQRLLHFRRSILTEELMRSLSRLETLYLILEDDLSPRLAHMMAMTGKSLVDYGGNRIDPGLETLSLLPLKEAFVEVQTPEILQSDENRYTEIWRKEYAEMVQKFLLNGQT